MGFRVCKHVDPFTKRVREVYRANVVRAPKVGLDPYWVLAVRDDSVHDLGELRHLLVDGALFELPAPVTGNVADLTGVRSSTLDVGAGLGLAAGFLAALGVPSPELVTALLKVDRSAQLAFEVHDVTESVLDLGALGATLKGSKVDRQNPAAAIFFEDADVKMHVVTRVLKACRFTLHGLDGSGASAAIKTAGVAKVLADVAASVSTSSVNTGTVTFTGPLPATFAIATVPCNIDVTGRFTFGLSLGGLNFLGPSGGESELLVEHFPVVDYDGLLDLDASEGDTT